jgi:hypothetical protein
MQERTHPPAGRLFRAAQPPVTATGCPKTDRPTRAHKLKATLNACQRKNTRARRAACEHRAREQYGSIRRASAIDQ